MQAPYTLTFSQIATPLSVQSFSLHETLNRLSELIVTVSSTTELDLSQYVGQSAIFLGLQFLLMPLQLKP